MAKSAIGALGSIGSKIAKNSAGMRVANSVFKKGSLGYKAETSFRNKVSKILGTDWDQIPLLGSDEFLDKQGNIKNRQGQGKGRRRRKKSIYDMFDPDDNKKSYQRSSSSFSPSSSATFAGNAATDKKLDDQIRETKQSNLYLQSVDRKLDLTNGYLKDVSEQISQVKRKLYDENTIAVKFSKSSKTGDDLSNIQKDISSIKTLLEDSGGLGGGGRSGGSGSNMLDDMADMMSRRRGGAAGGRGGRGGRGAAIAGMVAGVAGGMAMGGMGGGLNTNSGTGESSILDQIGEAGANLLGGLPGVRRPPAAQVSSTVPNAPATTPSTPRSNVIDLEVNPRTGVYEQVKPQSMWQRATGWLGSNASKIFKGTGAGAAIGAGIDLAINEFAGDAAKLKELRGQVLEQAQSGQISQDEAVAAIKKIDDELATSRGSTAARGAVTGAGGAVGGTLGGIGGTAVAPGVGTVAGAIGGGIAGSTAADYVLGDAASSVGGWISRKLFGGDEDAIRKELQARGKPATNSLSNAMSPSSSGSFDYYNRGLEGTLENQNMHREIYAQLKEEGLANDSGNPIPGKEQEFYKRFNQLNKEYSQRMARSGANRSADTLLNTSTRLGKEEREDQYGVNQATSLEQKITSEKDGPLGSSELGAWLSAKGLTTQNFLYKKHDSNAYTPSGGETRETDSRESIYGKRISGGILGKDTYQITDEEGRKYNVKKETYQKLMELMKNPDSTRAEIEQVLSSDSNYDPARMDMQKITNKAVQQLQGAQDQTQSYEMADTSLGGGVPQSSGPSGVPQSSGPSDETRKYLQSIALLESGGKADAKAATSSAGGLFQFTKGTFKEVAQRMGKKDWTEEDRFDPKKSEEAAAYLTNMNKAQIEKATGREATAKDLYMGHFLGGGGASKFLGAMSKDPNQIAANLVGENAANANKSIFYKQDGTPRTAQEVYDLMGGKVDKAQAAIESGKWGNKALPETIANIGGNNTNQPVLQSNMQMAQAGPMAPASSYGRANLQPQPQLPMFPAQDYGKTTLNPSGRPSATQEPTSGGSPVTGPYMQPGTVPPNFDLNKMPPSGLPVPEPMQRRSGEVIDTMGSELASAKDEASGGGSPTIINNNTNNNNSGGGQQQPSTAIASIRNDENSLMRMQNFMSAYGVT